ncbi:hypothetical protein R9C00_18340 [Flammeovirgaceae bacterium SG7u.111]|nr:hypothetical protein [Flammeovirgaceae bacterium SG7u.132]WPO33665.1 hypothetical protein R9C00_18340 [Flammeovirgaceae bacterium SG7u.111]
MKRYIKYFLAVTASLLLMWGCSDEYIAPTGEPNDAYVTTSFGTVESRLQIYGEMDFADLSRGVQSRTWTFPEGVVELDDETSNTVSFQQIVKAKFMKAGVYEVKMEQIYAGNVFFNGVDQGVNKYDTTFMVTVLDSVKANFEAVRVKEGTALTNANGALNEVIASREVLLTSTSVGEPTTFAWVFTSESGKVVTFEGNPATARFSSMEKYNMMLIASSPLGADTISYTDYMNVIPSTDPVELVGIKADAKVLSMEFSRDMFSPAINPASSITLSVTNDGKTYPVNVTGFSLQSGANNIIDMALDAAIYNSDIITVSYDASVGNLRTVDGVSATSFTDQPAVFTLVNMLPETSYDYGFEKSTDANWAYLWWGGVWEMYSSSVTNAMAYEGDKSIKIDFDANGGMIMGHKDDLGNNVTVPLEGGKTYEVGCWVYVENLGDKTSTPNIRFYWAPETDWGIGDNVAFDADFPEGKWVYRSGRMKPATDNNYSFNIRGHNEFNSQELNFYMDNITVAELDLRP